MITDHRSTNSIKPQLFFKNLIKLQISIENVISMIHRGTFQRPLELNMEYLSFQQPTHHQMYYVMLIAAP